MQPVPLGLQRGLAIRDSSLSSSRSLVPCPEIVLFLSSTSYTHTPITTS